MIMKNTKILQTLVILEWIILITAVTLSSLFLDGRLPLELRQWIDANLESEFTTGDVLLLTFLVVNFVGSIGLYNLKKWGAWIYIGSLVLSLALTPFTGPIVVHGIASAMYDVAVIITGMIIALAFFTDVLSGNKNSISYAGEST